MYENETLNEREVTHGDYQHTAKVAEKIKTVIHLNFPDKHGLDMQKHSLDLIATKMARLLCGDINCLDSWEDIAGYANLISERLKQKAPTANVCQCADPSVFRCVSGIDKCSTCGGPMVQSC